MPITKSVRLFLQAVNIHSGGGKSLLDSLLDSLPHQLNTVGQIDSRMVLNNQNPNLSVRAVPPSLHQRIWAEWWLKRNVTQNDLVICFGNLPPLFKLHGRSIVFLQNRYLIDQIKLKKFPLKTKLRLWGERIWLSSAQRHCDLFVVQTPSMRDLLENHLKVNTPIKVIPFIESTQGYSRKLKLASNESERSNDFIYVASGEPHKNHFLLLDAWELLAKDGLFPSLVLTLDQAQFPVLCAQINERIQRSALKILNVGLLTPAQVVTEYKQAKALIYPSLFESFGLPLIEARQAGLAVLASELDFVRDVLDPEETFNPHSARSIAMAVKRFLNIEAEPLPLHTASQFLSEILERSIK